MWKRIIGRRRRVSERDVKNELLKIIKETKAPIIISGVFEEMLSFDMETKNILTNHEKLAWEMNKILREFPGVNWRKVLRRMVDHEMVHKNQLEFLSARGIPLEEQDDIYFHYIKEFQAENEVPLPVRTEYFRRSIRRASPDEIKEALKNPTVWINSALSFSRGEIRKIFGPLDFADDMISLKSLGEKVVTKQDLVEYAQEAKRLIGTRLRSEGVT